MPYEAATASPAPTTSLKDEDIRNEYLQALGREPTANELKEAHRLMNTGFVDLSAGDVRDIAMGAPDARAQQLQRFGGQYEQNLAGSDSRYLQQAQDQISSDFARQGRGFGGSAYVAAFANAARDLAMNRQQQLAGFYGQGYQSIFGEIGQRSNQARQFGMNSLQTNRQREYDTADYYRQQDDYNNALRGQQTRNMQSALVNGAIGLGTSVAGGFAGGMGMAKGASMFGGAAKAAGGMGGGGGGQYGFGAPMVQNYTQDLVNQGFGVQRYR